MPQEPVQSLSPDVSFNVLLHQLMNEGLRLREGRAQLEQSTAQLSHSLRQYARVAENAAIGFLSLDEDGVIRTINPSALKLLGAVDSGDVRKRPLADRIVEEDRSQWQSCLDAVCETGAGTGDLRFEVDGAALLMHLLLRRLDRQDACGGAISVALIPLPQRQGIEQRLLDSERKLAAANTTLKRRTALLRRLAQQLARSEQNERKRIAAVLHDDVQQTLVAASMWLEQVNCRKLSKEDRNRLEQVDVFTRESCQKIRSLSSELRPPMLEEEGLASALDWLSGRLEHLHKLNVAVRVEQAVDIPDQTLRDSLFQSIRELLFNIVKHAETDAAEIVIGGNEEGVRIQVCDHGKGFDPALLEQEQAHGVGLLSVRERMEAWDGKLEIESMPGNGTTVTLLAPLTGVERGDAQGRSAEAAPALAPAAGAAGADAATKMEAEPRPAAARVAVLVVDDHAVVRAGIVRLLSDQPDMRVVGEAEDGQQALEQAAQHQPDVVLMDINMPRLNGIEATRALKRRFPRMKVIGLSMHAGPDVLGPMRDAGADGYHEKTADWRMLMRQVRQSVGMPEPAIDIAAQPVLHSAPLFEQPARSA